MGLSVRKNLGGLTGKVENVQEEPTIFKTKPQLQKRSKKITEKKEVAKRNSIEEELRELTKRRMLKSYKKISHNSTNGEKKTTWNLTKENL